MTDCASPSRVQVDSTGVPLLADGRTWAHADLLPWDQEAFGFPVGRIISAGVAPDAASEASAVAALRNWAEASQAALVCAAAPAAALDWVVWLARIGFVCVDLTLSVSLTSFARRPRTVRAAGVRPAQPEDHPAIVEIAGTAFDFGRYHRDPRFPRPLADRRFARWVDRALAGPGPGQCFLVTGPVGSPTAFMFFTVKDGHADWHLAGAARSAASFAPGPMLFAGVLDALESQGVRSVFSKISAANTSVLNIYAALGFRFSSPEYTFHWIPAGSVLASHSI